MTDGLDAHGLDAHGLDAHGLDPAMPLDEIDFFDPSINDCPYHAYRAMRDEAPVWFDSNLQAYVITRHEDVRTVLVDTERFVNSRKAYRKNRSVPEITKIYEEKGWIPAPTLAGRDDPEHKQMRALFDHAFRPKRISRLEPQIEGLAHELIDALTHFHHFRRRVDHEVKHQARRHRETELFDLGQVGFADGLNVRHHTRQARDQFTGYALARLAKQQVAINAFVGKRRHGVRLRCWPSKNIAAPLDNAHSKALLHTPASRHFLRPHLQQPSASANAVIEVTSSVPVGRAPRAGV